MIRIAYSTIAKEDLLSIWSFIAADNVGAADRLLHTTEEKCGLLADNPNLGRARPDIRPGLRYLPVGNYLILYHRIAEGIEVVRVIHGARDLHGIFQSGE